MFGFKLGAVRRALTEIFKAPRQRYCAKPKPFPHNTDLGNTLRRSSKLALRRRVAWEEEGGDLSTFDKPGGAATLRPSFLPAAPAKQQEGSLSEAEEGRVWGRAVSTLEPYKLLGSQDATEHSVFTTAVPFFAD